MSKTRIVMLSAGDLIAASSRLRCFFLGLKLKELGLEVFFNEAPATTDVVFVQKRITPQISSYAQIAKQRGAVIIYDLDDYGPALAWLNIDPKIEADFLAICDGITTDTPTRLEHLSHDQKFAHIRFKSVVPDPIDYMLEPKVKAYPAETGHWRGAWFGISINLTPAIPFLQSAADCKNVGTVDVITNADTLPNLRQSLPKFSFHAWALETFAQTLDAYDFTVLIHAQDIEGEQKSNNKMLVALALGVVPFVSDTAAYKNTAHDIGIPELVVKSPEELASKVGSDVLMSELRQRLGSSQCNSYLNGFTAKHIASQFNDALKQLIRPQSS